LLSLRLRETSSYIIKRAQPQSRQEYCASFVVHPTLSQSKIRQVSFFMRLLLKSFFAAFLAIASAFPALASETRVVPANRPSAIFFYYSATEDTCYSGAKPRVHVGGLEHGSVTTAWRAFTVSKGRCAGKPAHGTLVVYQPTPGYHGPDKVSLIFSGDAPAGYFSRAKQWIVNITVK
jgi:hypothetical protein